MKESPLIRGYLWANAKGAKRKPIAGDSWVRNTIIFGRKVMVIGALFLLLCLFLPADPRRVVMIALGVLVLAVGYWNTHNAQAIFDAAQRARRSTPR